MKLSVIIPVYNAEATLDRCVASVLAYPSQEMELILVNDGSTDKSGVLCEEWEKTDQRTKVVNKENGGLSDARNAGIEVAAGEYLAFVDSDDYLADNTLECLMEVIAQHPEYDLIEYPINQNEGASNEHLLSFPDKVYADVSKYWYETKAYLHSYACNKVYRRKLFQEVRYPVGKVFEDIYTLPYLLETATIVATCSKGLYHYCYNKHGISSQAGGREWQMLLDAHLQIAEMPAFTAYNDSQYYFHLVNIQLLTNELTGAAPVIADCPYCSVRNLKSIILYIFGIKKLCNLNRLYRKFIKRRS